MSGVLNKLITTALFFAVAVMNMAAQNPVAVNAGTTSQYHIDKQPEIAAYNWTVYTNQELSSPAAPADVALITLGAGRENEIEVSWITAGVYYLTISVTGTDGCDNTMAFPFQVISDGSPIAVNDFVTTIIGQPLTVEPLVNDIFSGEVVLSIVTGAVYGSAQQNPDGTLFYSPFDDFAGADSIVYAISNAYGSDTAIVYVTVNPLVVLNTSAYCNGEIAYYSWNVEAQGINIETINLSVYDETGVLVDFLENVPVSGNKVWPVEAGAMGEGALVNSAALQNISLNAEYDVASFTDVLEATLSRPDCSVNTVVAVFDTASVYGLEIELDVLANDFDPDGDEVDAASLIVLSELNTIEQGPFHGVLNLTYKGTIIYTPDPGYSGLDSFVYRVCDTRETPACDTAIVRLSLFAADELVANNDRYRLYKEQSAIFDVLANDYSPNSGIDLASVLVIVDPENGNAIANPDGSISYLPLPYFEGLDSFQYRVCDLGTPQACDSAWVFVNVRENSCVVALHDTVSTFVNESVNLAILHNDYDFENELDSAFVIIQQPSNGAVVTEADYSITYSPNLLFAGIDSFIYRVSDRGYPVCSDTAIVYITVIDNNQPIVALPDVANVLVDSLLTLNILANDYDPDGQIDLSSVQIITPPINGQASIENGMLHYTPNLSYFGSDTLIYSVCDNGPIVSCDTAKVIIHINQKENVPPVALNDTLVVWAFENNSFEILANDYDTDGTLDTASVIIVREPQQGSISFDTISGTMVYVPADCAFGTDTLSYIVYDNREAASNLAVVFLQIQMSSDLDADADGIPNIAEDINGNGNICDDDTDGDGIPNYLDPDDDDDCMSTADEIALNGWDFDLDENGIPNYLDWDDNGDGIPSCDQMLDLDGSGILDRDEIWNSQAMGDDVTIGVDEVAVVPVLDNDSRQMDPQTMQITLNPSSGYLELDESNWLVSYFPDLDFVGLDTFVYAICDYYGRCDTATVKVYVQDIIFPPQLFTPNDDGDNDFYVIRGLDRYPDNQFTVYSRWGNKVFEYSGYYDQWDGHSNAKMTVGSRKLPVGVYYYVIRYGNNREKAGALFLER